MALNDETEKTIKIKYTNYRGETRDRVINPDHIWFGSTEWHPEDQWLMSCWDVEKGAARTLALRGIEKIY